MRRMSTGRAPFGYAWQEDRLVLVPAEAAVRKRMYELFLEMPRKGAVAKQLNDEGLTTRNGGKWTDNTVGRNLPCTSAKGVSATNKTTTDAEGNRVPRPESEWNHYECERLVSDEIWDEVQRLAGVEPEPSPSPAKTPAAPRIVHPFAGLAFCACGEKMRVPSNTPKYVCPSCRTKIPIDDLEGIFQDELGDFLADRKDLLARFVADPVAGKRSLAISKTQAVLQKLEFERDNVLSLFHAKKLSFQEFGERNQPLEAKIASTRETLQSLERSETDISDAEAVDPVAFCHQWPQMSPQSRRAIATAFLDRVVIGDRKLDFMFRFGDSPAESPAEIPTNSTPGTFRVAEVEPSLPDTVRAPVDPPFIRLPRDGERCPWTGLTRAWINKLIFPAEGTNDPPRVRSFELVDPGKSRGVRLIDFASLMSYIRSQASQRPADESEPTDDDP